MTVHFTKMQGLGNDFVLLDARAAPLDLTPAQLRVLGDRRYGVGCDQILLIDAPTLPGATVRYRVFNADGSAAQHCGNGVRCVARYLALHDGLGLGSLRVEIAGRDYELMLEPAGIVRVDMGEPNFTPAALLLVVSAPAARYPLSFKGEAYAFGAVSMGNPHAVLAVVDVDAAPVAELGAQLQADAMFPERVNVGFMQVLDASRIRLRVFERGAGETPACGTGACGAVAVGRLWGTLAEHVTVHLTGGDLRIDWPGPGHSLWMSGPAVSVFEGNIEL
jgi:diaminopimelate epimerase